MFEYKVSVSDGDVLVELKGRLDSGAAPNLHKDLAALAGEGVKEVIFDAEGLEYIASAGLRVIIFSKHRFGNETEIIVKGASEAVKEVLEITGTTHFVSVL